MELKLGESFTPYNLAKNEDYMSDKQLRHFNNILLNWQQSITGNNDAAVTSLQEDTSQISDQNDRASLEEEFSLTLRARDRERKLIYKIKLALDRIAAEDFGYCENCDAEIGIKRLEARPTAELCIDCKEIEEKREKTRL